MSQGGHFLLKKLGNQQHWKFNFEFNFQQIHKFIFISSFFYYLLQSPTSLFLCSIKRSICVYANLFLKNYTHTQISFLKNSFLAQNELCGLSFGRNQPFLQKRASNNQSRCLFVKIQKAVKFDFYKFYNQKFNEIHTPSLWSKYQFRVFFKFLDFKLYKFCGWIVASVTFLFKDSALSNGLGLTTKYLQARARTYKIFML